ncbi:hypothetical protein N7448_008258 [Penicillium atrosanguineum]|nr:hypothetical protein N7448_008258 [Penicillium atrosanguineum]
MGNSQTKESRTSTPRRRSHQGSPGASDAPGRTVYQSSRLGRGSRPDLSLLGIGSSHDRDVAALEQRRETKQEREARRLEKERVARVKERERSMKEEHVDGGYLVTQGVYVGTEDFNKAVVRQLMIERRLAPFWRGLNDFSESWAEHQLMAAARGMSIPPTRRNPTRIRIHAAQGIRKGIARSVKYPSSHELDPRPVTTHNISDRIRHLSFASLPDQSEDPGSPDDIKDPFVNGSPIEVNLYKDASECPICFLYYPPYLNRTRCCDQPICSECFVQIKRPDPHPPEHGEVDSNAPPQPEGEQAETEGQLVSEPSACPFCVQPEFGVTYASPPFRRGLTYAADPSARPSPMITSPVSSTSSLSSANLAPIIGRRRATSLSAADPSVVTTDKVRPDWAQKLANARAHTARRSAAATALHTAAYLMNTGQSGSDSRHLGLSRRGLRRATQGESGRSGSPALNALAFLTDRPDRTPPRPAAPDTDSAEEGANIAPPRDSSRRTRMDDLEEMMMMEAIRLSLASEEERRKREEKEIKKEAKRREKEKEKEAKKADKVARKTGLSSNNASTTTLSVPGESRIGGSSSIGEDTSAGKGKAVDRAAPSMAVDFGLLGSSTSAPIAGPIPENPAAEQALSAEPSRPSHLRHVSSASSSFSSIMEANPDERTGSQIAADGSNTSLEPMFNFRSLAEVIGDEEKGHESEHVEDSSAPPKAEGSSSATPSVNQPSADPLEAESKSAVIPQVEIEDSSHGMLPKELETRSVEITGTTPHTEAT